MKHIGLSLVLGLAFVGCSGDESSQTSESELKNPKIFAQEAASEHHAIIFELEGLVKDKVSNEELMSFHESAEMRLLEFGQAANTYSPEAKSIYSQEYMLKAYEEIDTVMMWLTRHKDSLRTADPLDEIALILQQALAVGVYGDFDQLRRVYPSAYEDQMEKKGR